MQVPSSEAQRSSKKVQVPSSEAQRPSKKVQVRVLYEKSEGLKPPPQVARSQ
ncbi:hypothetical protein [Nostoc sp.]|uniref:hypothetical protein n=1 Tax=Nostoc sp. TaxID=1180 RepID=UPI002FF538AA